MENTDRVGSWSQTVQRVSAFCACHELATEIEVSLVRVLLFVEAYILLSI
jgi:hypothetical protein